MNAVYYRHESTGYCPVKAYFSQYTNPRGIKIVAETDARIQYLLANEGKAPFAKPVRGHTFSQFGIRKTASILIRILFFRHANQLVLLRAFDKPDNYKPGSKIDRAVNKRVRGS